MALPNSSVIRSYPGGATPTYLAAALINTYASGQTFTVTNTTGWYEVSASGYNTSNPLGTSGPYTLVVDYGLPSEEKILCASGSISLGINTVISVWTDGTLNGRGYDGTSAQSHAVGTSTDFNVFPVSTAIEQAQFNYVSANAVNFSTALTGEGDVTGTFGDPVLINVMTSGTYGSAGVTPQLTVDSKGRITGLSEDSIFITETQVSGLSADLSTIYADITGLNTNYTALSGEVNTISGSVTSLTSTISGLSSNYTALSISVSGVEVSVATISGNQVTDESNIATISGNVVTLSGQQQTTATNLANVTTNLSTLSGYVATISGKQVTDETNISNLTSYVATISGKQVTDETNIATISGKQVTDETNIASLSGSLATLSGNAILNGTTAGGDLTGTYPNPSLITISGVSGTHGTAATTPQITTDSNGRITAISAYSISIGEAQVNGLLSDLASISGNISTISGKQATDATNISTLSGQMVTANANIASTSGSLSTLSGQYVTTSGQTTTNTANIASTSGSLATLSGQFVTLSGIAVVSGTTAGGDLHGAYPNPTVTGIQGIPVSSVAPANNQLLRYNSTSGMYTPQTSTLLIPTATLSGNYTANPNDYVVQNARGGAVTVTLPHAPSNDSTIAVASLSTSLYDVTVVPSGTDTIPTSSNQFVLGTGVFNSVTFVYASGTSSWLIDSNQFGEIAGGDLGGTYPNPTVEAIQGVPVSATPPNTGQVLMSVGGVWTPASGIAGAPGPGGANGYWLSAYDTTTQTVASTSGVYPINIGSTFGSNGITTSTSGHITFGYTGTYNVQYSIQFNNTDSNADQVNVWLRKNGSDVANSNSQYDIPGTGHGGSGATIGAVNYVVSLNANDYLQLMWQSSSTNVSIATFSGTTSPTIPETPGVIFTVTQNMYNQTGTYTVNNIAASGTNQATAPVLTGSTWSAVTSATATSNGGAGTGVILPVPSYQGQWAKVNNDSNNWLIVYPQVSGTIDGGATNSGTWVPPNSAWSATAETLLDWETEVFTLVSPSLSVNYQTAPGQISLGLPTAGTAGTYGTTSGIPVVTTDIYGRVTNVTVTGVQIAESEVTGLTTDLSNISGSLSSNNSNLSTLSGYVATISGKQVTDEANIATLSGNYVALSGSLVNYYPKTGGTVSGNVVVASGLTVSGNAGVSGTLTTSGLTVANGVIATNTDSIAINNAGTGPSAANNANGGISIGTNAGSTLNTYGTAIGYNAGITNEFGTAIGYRAGQYYNDLGVAIGYEAGYQYNYAGVAIGRGANINNTGSPYTVAIGYNTQSTGQGSVAIGTDSTSVGASASGTNQFVLGTALHNVNVPGAFAVSGTAAVSGSLTTYSGVTLSGNSLNIYSSTVGGVTATSGQALVYSGSQWVPGTVASSGPTAVVINDTNQTSAVSGTLLAVSGTGLYTISYYGKVTTAASTSSTIGPLNFTSTDPDGNSVVSYGESSSQNSVTTAFISDSVTVYAASGTNILYNMGYASSGSTAMQYNLHISVTSQTQAVSMTNTVNNISGIINTGPTATVTIPSSNIISVQASPNSSVTFAGNTETVGAGGTLAMFNSSTEKAVSVTAPLNLASTDAITIAGNYGGYGLGDSNMMATGNGITVQPGNQGDGFTAVMYSTDGGKTWNSSGYSNAAMAICFSKFIGSDGGFLMVSGPGIFTSTDGNTWTNVSSITFASGTNVYGNSGDIIIGACASGDSATIVLVDNIGNVYYSTNAGSTWSTTTAALIGYDTTYNFFNVTSAPYAQLMTWLNGYFYIGGTNGNNYFNVFGVSESSLSSTWTEYNAGFSTMGMATDGVSTIATVGYQSPAYEYQPLSMSYSTNGGATWTYSEITSTTGYIAGSIIYGDGFWVIPLDSIDYQSSDPTAFTSPLYYYSSDLINWFVSPTIPGFTNSGYNWPGAVYDSVNKTYILGDTLETIFLSIDAGYATPSYFNINPINATTIY
jgi:hypothetical protein